MAIIFSVDYWLSATCTFYFAQNFVGRSVVGLCLCMLLHGAEEGECNPMTEKTRPSVPVTEHLSEVTCVDYGQGAKGYRMNDIDVYFACSAFTCPGVFGCERCCLPPTAPRDPKTHTTMAKKVQGDEDDKTIPTVDTSPFKDKIFLSLGGILVILILVAIVVYIRLCRFLYCSKADDMVVETEISANRNVIVNFKTGMMSGEKTGFKSTSPLKIGSQKEGLLNASLQKSSPEKTSAGEKAYPRNGGHQKASLLKGNLQEPKSQKSHLQGTFPCKNLQLKCDAVPQNDRKLGGRSCKENPKSIGCNNSGGDETTGKPASGDNQFYFSETFQ